MTLSALDFPDVCPTLTSREQQVLEQVACGLTAKQIAESLDLAPRTVARHVEACRCKLRARTKVRMVVKGYEFGLLDPQKHSPRSARPVSWGLMRA